MYQSVKQRFRTSLEHIPNSFNNIFKHISNSFKTVPNTFHTIMNNKHHTNMYQYVPTTCQTSFKRYNNSSNIIKLCQNSFNTNLKTVATYLHKYRHVSSMSQTFTNTSRICSKQVETSITHVQQRCNTIAQILKHNFKPDPNSFNHISNQYQHASNQLQTCINTFQNNVKHVSAPFTGTC